MKAQEIPFEILMVEDDPGDVELTREGLGSDGHAANINAVPDGMQAIRYLRREGQHSAAVRPDLILLDLNLPRMDGRELLRELKADEALKSIPVIVFTTSAADSDVRQCYELGANCYMTKPIGYAAFMQAMRALKEFWLGTVKLPPRTGQGGPR